MINFKRVDRRTEKGRYCSSLLELESFCRTANRVSSICSNEHTDSNGYIIKLIFSFKSTLADACDGLFIVIVLTVKGKHREVYKSKTKYFQQTQGESRIA